MYLYTSGNDPLDTDIIKPAAGAANAMLSMRSNFCQKVSKRKKRRRSSSQWSCQHLLTIVSIHQGERHFDAYSS